MTKLLNLFVGFDQKESIAYHAFAQSIIENSSIPLSITPLAENNLSIYLSNTSTIFFVVDFTFNEFII